MDNNSIILNLYIKAKIYFRHVIYIKSLNHEEYKYTATENNEEKIIDLKSIKNIQYKINFPNEAEIRLKGNKEIPEGQEKISLEKALLLLKYKEVVSNIELIE